VLAEPVEFAAAVEFVEPAELVVAVFLDPGLPDSHLKIVPIPWKFPLYRQFL